MGNQLLVSSDEDQQQREEQISFASPNPSTSLSPKIHRYDGSEINHSPAPLTRSRFIELDDVNISENEDTFHANFIIEYLIQNDDTQSKLCLQFNFNFETLFQYNYFQLPLSSNSVLEDNIQQLNSVFIPISQSTQIQKNNVELVFKNFCQSKESLRQPSSLLFHDDWISLDTSGNLILKQYFWPTGQSKTISLNNVSYLEKKTLATLRGHCVVPNTFFVHFILAQFYYHQQQQQRTHQQHHQPTPLIQSEQQFMEQVNQAPLLLCKERNSPFPILFTCKDSNHCQQILELAAPFIN